MRVVTMGLSLPAPAATRIRFRDSLPLDGFDALVLDPDAVLAEYAAEIERRDPDPVLSVRGSQTLLADLRRRRSDMTALLARGGAIVFHPPGPAKLRAHTLEALIDVTPAMTLPIDRVATEPGSGARPVARGGEPFARFAAALADDLICRDVLADPPGEALFLDATGRAAGFYLAQNRGHVLAVPRTGATDRFGAALAGLLRRLMSGDDHAVPVWTREHRLPGEDALRQRLDALQSESRRVAAELVQAQAALYPFEQRKLLLTGAGRALYDAACLAFWDLGCSVYQGPIGDTDLFVEWGDRTACVETIGRDGPITAADVETLLASLAALTRAAASSAKPMLLAVPHRDLPLAERPQPSFTPEVASLARSRGVALVLGHQLLAAAAAAWQKRLDPAATLQRLFDEAGPVALSPR